MAIIEWREGGHMRLRVECLRDEVATHIERQRRAGTPGQVYIDNQPFDDRGARISELEETVKLQTDLLGKLCRQIDSLGKREAPNGARVASADPRLDELVRRAEELKAGPTFQWRIEFLRSLIETNKEKDDG